MKTLCSLFLFLYFLIPIRGYSQHILNGSFEDNSSPYCYFGSGCGAWDVYAYFPYVYLANIDTTTHCGQLSGIYKDTLNCAPFYGKVVPDGKVSMGLMSDHKDKDSASHLAFELSSGLVKGQPYIIRYASASWFQPSSPRPNDSILIGLSNNRYSVSKELGGIIPLDSIGYRDYAIAFIPDSNYNYIDIYQANYKSNMSSPLLIDNIRLDTCIQLNTSGITRIYSSPLCNPMPITLQARNGPTYGNFWNTGDTTLQIQVSTPGFYVAITYYNYTCATVDSFEIIDLSSTHIDTTVCENAIVALTTKPNAKKYSWSSGDTTQSIMANHAGIYIARSIYGGGCMMAIDTFTVNYYPLSKLTLPSDTAFCEGDSITLDATNSNYTAYLWNTGDTLPELIVSDTGKYIIKATKGDCSIYDTVSVSSYASSSLDFPSDTSFCKGSNITLKVSNPEYDQYLWSTGSTKDSIVIADSGLYHVTASNTHCAVHDTISAHLVIPDTLNLAADTSICPGTSLTLDATHTNYLMYQWNTGDTSPTITVSTAGAYTVTASAGNCKTSDSTHVYVHNAPNVHLPRDTAVCFDELKEIILDAGHWKTYTWYPTGEHTRSIAATYPEIYIVVVTDSNNCIGSDTALVEEECPSDLYVPNVFTPNGDAINDVFLARGYGIEIISMKVYDRWGKLIFESKDINKGWDGTANNTPSAVAVYLYTIEYVTKKSNEKKSMSGNFTLLR